MALEDRSSGYQDLVSQQQRAAGGDEAQGAVADLLRSARSARRCRSASKSAQWYSGYDQLLNPAIDLFNDAFFDPKMVVVPIILSMQEILNNEGDAQLMDVYDSYISAAEKALEDAMDAGIYSRRHRQRQQADHRACDRDPDRQHHRHLWRHRSRPGDDLAHHDLRRQLRSSPASTQVTSTTIRPMLNYVMTQRSRAAATTRIC